MLISSRNLRLRNENSKNVMKSPLSVAHGNFNFRDFHFKKIMNFRFFDNFLCQQSPNKFTIFYSITFH